LVALKELCPSLGVLVARVEQPEGLLRVFISRIRPIDSPEREVGCEDVREALKAPL
jgi:hypothetical protein